MGHPLGQVQRKTATGPEHSLPPACPSGRWVSAYAKNPSDGRRHCEHLSNRCGINVILSFSTFVFKKLGRIREAGLGRRCMFDNVRNNMCLLWCVISVSPNGSIERGRFFPLILNSVKYMGISARILSGKRHFRRCILI